MLDTDTKRRIDSCRDILVGKVPDPKSQVEQITIALIYKFMDDMDAEAEELGGARSFFSGDYAKYGWARLMAPSMGGFDVLALYSEAIGKMNENPGVPPLFRDIFKNAYLPYRDPETLRSFLKEINDFTYDHSERLGDAFEYLLSVLGSQGDAGQFRTPRHIIDFMVEIIDPKKNESILDPACGTAGFLISAWKHILKHNTKERSGDLLTPDERQYLAANIRGYDISPDMVRLSLVNLYLHGFTDPHVVEYDTLTSEEKWNETADIILANPPFMSPKGGIKPHKRFSVQATRSEVLFVDYMAEHLSPQGRAAIVVPEGIIFQSGTAYKKLREMLVKNSLVAVVSLPSGVFNPYSGVKTSILILDKRLAKTSDSVLFVKVENDGFNLGAQRRAVTGSGLPDAVAAYRAFRYSRESGNPAAFDPAQFANAHVVEKTRIGENGEWNLSGDRYIFVKEKLSDHPIVRLGEIVEVVMGQAPAGDTCNTEGNGAPFVKVGNFGQTYPRIEEWTTNPLKMARHDDTLVCVVGATIGKINKGIDCAIGRSAAAVRPNKGLVNPDYLYRNLLEWTLRLRNSSQGSAIGVITKEMLFDIIIPLPPLAIQQEIVAEIEGYQKIIDGAKQVVENYRPRITVQPDWPVLDLGNLCSLSSGGTPSKANAAYWNGEVPWLSAKDMKTSIIADAALHITEVAVAESATRIAPAGSLLILVRGMGLANGVPICELAANCAFNQDIKAIHPKANVTSAFLRLSLAQQQNRFAEILGTAGHGTLKIDTDDLLKIRIALPDLVTQRAIVAEIEAEQALVNANKELIRRFEAKIKIVINRVWGKAE